MYMPKRLDDAGIRQSLQAPRRRLPALRRPHSLDQQHLNETRERDRAKELADRQVIGAADLDAARSKYEQAVADLAAADAQVGQARASVGVARVDLEHTTIRAPISGVVLSRAVDVGQTVAASLQAPT